MSKSVLPLFTQIVQGSDKFSIIVFPKELIDFSVENFTSYLGMLFDYFTSNGFGSDQ